MTLEERIENLVALVGDGDLYRYEASEIIFELAEEFAIGFAFYLSDNYTSRTLDTWDDAVGIRFTTNEVLKIYKKEKGL